MSRKPAVVQPDDGGPSGFAHDELIAFLQSASDGDLDRSDLECDAGAKCTFSCGGVDGGACDGGTNCTNVCNH